MRTSIRSASLNGYVDVAHAAGLDAETLMRVAGLDPADLAVPDRWVSAAAGARLLEQSAIAADAPDFALRIAERRRLSTLGPLSMVLREEQDLRGALGLMMRYERSYSEAFRMRLSESHGLATLRIWLELGEPVPSSQSHELAVAAMHGIIREFVGESWHPLSVCFTHSPPPDRAAHIRYFGNRLRFGHEFAGLVLAARDLAAPSAVADPLLRPYAPQVLTSLVTGRVTTSAERVQEIVEVVLPLGHCSRDQVARALGVDARTLHRHLAAEGETFTGIVHRVRARLAERYLANDRYSITEVSQFLGFAAPSAFTHWFDQRFGVSPREWRTSTSAIEVH